MKPTELMINDWVDIQEDGKHLKYTKVHDLAEGHEEWYYFPIPLTEEMLKANGWEITKGNPSQGTMTRGFFQNIGFVYFFDDGIEFEIGIHIRVRGVINYVNQLQHAFRICGLNDLADNFKVE